MIRIICLFFIDILFFSRFCECQKLICDGKVINSEISSDIKVSFTRIDTVSEKFYPFWKTIFIIHGFSFEHQWTFEMGNKWIKKVSTYNFVF